MQEKVKEILHKILEWWNKFTSKQKTIIIGISAVAVFTFAILIYVFTKPQYTVWRTCESTSEAAEVREILDDAGITYDTGSDALVIRVLTNQLPQADLALGASGYVPDSWGIENVTNGGFSKTEADKQREYVVYREKCIEKAIQSNNSVKKAEVVLNIPEQTGTLIASKEEASAWVQLTLQDKISSDQAAAMARAVATGLGNDTTANIVIVDTDGNLLFSGEEDYTVTGRANSLLQLEAQAKTLIAGDIKKVLVGTGMYDMVEVAAHLDVDYSEYEETVHNYSTTSGGEQGYLSHNEIYESSNSGGGAAVPGTDSNDETGIMYSDGGISESEEREEINDYLLDEYIKKQITAPGVIKYENSSFGLTAISYRTIKEEDARRQGLLDGISWEEYKYTNDVRTQLEVPQELYNMVSNATGMPVDNITIIAYEEPQFIDAPGLNVNTTDILSIVLIIIILGLLAFVVIRSMLVKKEVESEEELSVENLLQSAPEMELEDIELEAKSETRKMIEKFVDDNPEAAANLLRNWLNEDWG